MGDTDTMLSGVRSGPDSGEVERFLCVTDAMEPKAEHVALYG